MSEWCGVCVWVWCVCVCLCGVSGCEGVCGVVSECVSERCVCVVCVCCGVCVCE